MTTKVNPRKPHSAAMTRTLLIPAALLVFAVLLLIAGDGAMAAGFLLAAIGSALVLVGRARRWKGAPEAGWLIAIGGALLALYALFA